MRTFFRLISVLINLTMATTSIVLIPLVISRRGLTWEVWLFATVAVLSTVALCLTTIAAIEGKEEKS